ncbi:MAG: HU family DNA-binding protein [Spirochaetaceae bacterium]|nr:MAG: HU family DNA-binding protein [Spirochaetaceae bacterium]
MDQFDQLPEKIQRHLATITSTSGLEKEPDALERITKNWLEKRRLYQEQAEALDMVDLEHFSADDPRAVMVLTYSGSLIGLEAAGKDGRRFEYASIKLRHDVPDLLSARNVELTSPIAVDHRASFQGSPVAQTSEVYCVTSFDGTVPIEEQSRRLREAMLFLTNGFAKINRTLTQISSELDHFTMHNIVQYIGRRCELTQAQIREVLDTYLSMVEAGMMMGERVPMGRLGRLYLKAKPARKARMGRNPATGEEIMIAAKPEVMTPRFSFSSRVKDRAERVPVESDQE